MTISTNSSTAPGHSGGGNRRGDRASFGSIRTLESGRFQARYLGEDGLTRTARTAAGKPLTFDTKRDAEEWLVLRRAEIIRGEWRPPTVVTAGPVTFGAYAEAWLANKSKLEIRVREEYASLLRNRILPTFADVPITEIGSDAVETWFAGMGPQFPTAKARAYGLLHGILATAVDRRVIDWNPCRIRGAGQVRKAKKSRPLTLPEYAALIAAMPARYRMASMLAVWCSLRAGEIAALRRGDFDFEAKEVRVTRAVSETKTMGRVIKAPKSEASTRDVSIPSHIIDDLRAHLDAYVEPGADAAAFPTVAGTPVAASTLYRYHVDARTAVGRTDVTFHGLRHTGQSYAAANGASLKELMVRAGQSTPDAALIYIHEVDGRQQEIADRLAAFATGATNVTPIASARAAAATHRRLTPVRRGRGRVS